MLTELREKSQSFLIYVLFGILIFVFIFFFGPQSDGCRPAGQTPAPNRIGWAATVNGEKVTQQEVEIAVRRQIYGTSDVSEADLARIRRDTLVQVIDQMVLAQRAEAAGLAVSEDDVSHYITDKDENGDYILFSDRQGAFDYERFTAAVGQQFGTNIATYRKTKARELLATRYMQLLTSQIQVSDAEVKETFEREARQWNLEYVAFDADALAEAAPPAAATPEEGLAWANEHAEDVKKYYDDNKSKYEHDTEVRVRRILLRVPKDQGDEGKAKARAEAEAVLALARAPGADFEKLAREKSQDYYKETGGDMGWQTKENTSPENFALYTKLGAGGISDLQESAIGVWFVKVEEVKPAAKRTLDEVKGEIGVLLAADTKKKQAAREKAEAALAAVRSGKTLAEVSPVQPPPPPPSGAEAPPVEEAPKPAVQETGLFSDDRAVWERIPNIGKSPTLAGKLPGLTTDKPLVESVIEVEDRFLVVRLKERVEPDAAKLPEKKLEIAARLRAQRGRQLFGSWQAVLFGRAMPREESLKVGGPIVKLLPDPAKDPGIEINQEAFALPAPASVAVTPGASSAP